MTKTTLILIRHGESEWNAKNLFTGWADPDITEKGIKEATEAGQSLTSFRFDYVYCSPLQRARHTAQLVLTSSNNESCLNQILIDPRIKERNYGDLKGYNKDEIKEKYGKEQVQIWRRSYDEAPPNGESLKQVVTRVSDFYNEEIKTKLNLNKTILIAAHGNSLRAMLIVLKLHTKDDIPNVEIPTGQPIVITFDKQKITAYHNIK